MSSFRIGKEDGRVVAVFSKLIGGEQSRAEGLEEARNLNEREMQLLVSMLAADRDSTVTEIRRLHHTDVERAS